MSEHDVEGRTAPSGGLPLSFDAWINLSARLMKRGEAECREILREQRLAAEDWKKCDDHFMRILADDISEGDGDLSARYGAACVEELERRKREVKAPPAAPLPSAPASEPEPAAVATPKELVPTYLLDPGGTSTVAQSPLHVKAAPAAMATTAALPAFLAQAAAAAEPLPFREQPSSDFLASLRAPREPAARVGLGETVPLGAELPLPKDVLPFVNKAPEGPKPKEIPRLPLQTYASLCVELSMFPDRVADVLKRYSLPDEETRRAIDLEWQRRFSAYPDTHQRWRDFCDEYRAYLLRQRR